jgi:hypothetical protein
VRLQKKLIGMKKLFAESMHVIISKLCKKALPLIITQEISGQMYQCCWI